MAIMSKDQRRKLAEPLSKKDAIHIFNRFGFGPHADVLDGFTLNQFKGYLNDEPNLWEKDLGNRDMDALRAHWMECVLNSNNQVFEKISLFWHHHFSVICNKPFLAISFSNSIRNFCLGGFRDLLLAISQSGAMLDFLDGKKNKAQSPNENFARELCEIYTLGVSNCYTESDVKEIARCFTGWKYDDNGEFYIREKQFDKGRKTVFGNTGNFNGEDIIDLILSKFECAQYLSKSMYTFFVNEIPNANHINEIARVLYVSEYNITEAFMHIVQSNWFFAEENIMTKIKSPIELIIGIGNDFKLQNSEPNTWSFVLKLLGQELYKPLNVKGWPEGRQWINSYSLPMRLLIPQIILGNESEELNISPDYDQAPGATMRFKQLSSRLDFKIDWQYFNSWSSQVSPYEKWFNGSLQNRFIQEDYRFLLSLPEYQLN